MRKGATLDWFGVLPEVPLPRLMALAVPEVQWLILGCVALLVRLPFSLALPHFVSAVVSALIHDDLPAVRTAIVCPAPRRRPGPAAWTPNTLVSVARRLI